MSYKVNFMDNQEVLALDLNQITERLGGGMLAFSNDTLYGVDDLNEISKTLVSKGVAEGCALTAQGDTVHIGAGVLFLESGQRVEIDEAGIDLTFAAGETQYVYFLRDAITGAVLPRCTPQAPSGDFVLLGYVNTAGTAESRPEIAIMKNGHLGANKEESFSLPLIRVPHDFNMEKTKETTITPTQSGYNYAILKVCQTAFWFNESACGTINLSTGESFGLAIVYRTDTKEYTGVCQSNNSAHSVAVRCNKYGGSQETASGAVVITILPQDDGSFLVTQRAIGTGANEIACDAELTITFC